MQYQIKHLGVGGVLVQAINLLKDHFGLLFGIVALTFLPAGLIIGFLQLQMGQTMANPAMPEVSPASSIAVIIAALVFALFIWPVANAATIYAVSSSYLSRPTSVGTCLSQGVRKWGAQIWTIIILYLVFAGLTIAVMVPTMIVVMIIGRVGLVVAAVLGVLALLFLLSLTLALQVTVLEGVSGTKAISRSRELMKGSLGSMFVLALLIGVIGYAVTLGVHLIPQPHVVVVISSIVQCLLTAFSWAALVIFYFSARCKHENFDLQLLSEAVEPS